MNVSDREDVKRIKCVEQLYYFTRIFDKNTNINLKLNKNENL